MADAPGPLSARTSPRRGPPWCPSLFPVNLLPLVLRVRGARARPSRPAPWPTPSRHVVAVSLTGHAFLHRGSPPGAPDLGPSQHPRRSLQEAGHAGCWWPWGGGTARGSTGPQMTSPIRASPAQRPSPPWGGWSRAGVTEGPPGKATAWPTREGALSGPACRPQASGTGHQEPGGCPGGLSHLPFLQLREDFCRLLLSRFPPLKRKADDALAATQVGGFVGRHCWGSLGEGMWALLLLLLTTAHGSVIISK